MTTLGQASWIEIALEGTRSNRSAIGATVVVSAGGRTQAQGSAESIELLLARRSPGCTSVSATPDRSIASRCDGPAVKAETLTNVDARRVADDQGDRNVELPSRPLTRQLVPNVAELDALRIGA